LNSKTKATTNQPTNQTSKLQKLNKNQQPTNNQNKIQKRFLSDD